MKISSFVQHLLYSRTILIELLVLHCRATSIFADLKQQYGAGNCHLLQINSKRAGQIPLDQDSLTNMPDPWRQYVKQNSTIVHQQQQQQQQQLVSKKDNSVNDSLSNLSELIDQELSLTSKSIFFLDFQSPYDNFQHPSPIR